MFHAYDPAMAQEARRRARQLRDEAVDHAWHAAHTESSRLLARFAAALIDWARHTMPKRADLAARKEA